MGSRSSSAITTEVTRSRNPTSSPPLKARLTTSRRACADRPFHAEVAEDRSTSTPRGEDVKERCRTSADLALCARLVSASFALVRVLHAHLGQAQETIPPYATTAGAPSLDAFDPFEVERTVATDYPSLQCRLDTLVRGVACEREREREHGHHPCEDGPCDVVRLGANRSRRERSQ